MGKLSGVISGVAGEYFVAAELSRRGYIASITLRNTRGIDILISNEDASRQASLQVKTNQGNRLAWLLSDKAEEYFAENYFYVFVNLNQENEYPDFYIVDSQTVSKHITSEHKLFSKTLRRDGQLHRATSMRMFRDPKEIYRSNWKILEDFLNGS